MKAIVQRRYGGAETLSLEEVKKPKIKDNQILVEAHSANIASGDMRINTLDIPKGLGFIMKLIFGFKGPRRKVRGVTGSGIIVETGKNVTNYKVGDEIYYINSMKAGCLAEYVALNMNQVMAEIPRGVTFNQASPLSFGAMTALHYINDKTVSMGDEILIYGASGAVGTYAVQLARYYGAEVTAVSSRKNHELLLSIGAKHTLDYKTEDFTTLSKKYDMVFDTVAKTKKREASKALKPNGKYKSTRTPTSEKISRLLTINEIVSKGRLKTVIAKEYSLEEYKEAHEHVYGKHKVGNVVINIK